MRDLPSFSSYTLLAAVARRSAGSLAHSTSNYTIHTSLSEMARKKGSRISELVTSPIAGRSAFLLSAVRQAVVPESIGA
jgi:hypothetical protein